MPETKTVTMVATQRQNYGVRNLKSGDEFEATEAEAADMVAMKTAFRKEGKPDRAKYQRRDLRARE